MAAEAQRIDFTRVKSIRGLDEALKTSFSHIKDDITTIRESVHQQTLKVNETKQVIQDSQSDFVTIDKFNVLKIRIGELNETMKKLWDLEKKLEDLDKKAVSMSEFDRNAAAWENEIKKLSKDVTDLKNTAVTESQTKALVKDVNEEFDKVKKAMDELRSIKDVLTREELDKRTDKLDKRADTVEKNFQKLREDFKSNATVTQVETLVGDINKEFDTVKLMVAQLRRDSERLAKSTDVEKKIQKVESRMAELSGLVAESVDEFSAGIQSTFNSFMKVNDSKISSVSKDLDIFKKRVQITASGMADDVSKELTDVRKDMKLLVGKRQVEALVGDINKEFDATKNSVDSAIKAVRQISSEAATRQDLKKTEMSVRQIRDQAATRKELQSTEKSVKQNFGDFAKKLNVFGDDVSKALSKNSEDLKSAKKDVSKQMREFVLRKELNKEIDAISSEFEKLYKDMQLIKKSMATTQDITSIEKRVDELRKYGKETYVEKKNFNSLLGSVDKFRTQLEIQNAALIEKSKDLKMTAKELKHAKKAEKKLSRYEDAEEKLASREKTSKSSDKVAKKQAKGGNFGSYLANFLIVVAFIALIVAIGMFFAGYTKVTDTLSIAAVICFVVGIVIRVVVAVKEK